MGNYPSASDWCWSNSRYYIAFNDIEGRRGEDCSYFYRRGMVPCLEKMVDGVISQSTSCIHHGRVNSPQEANGA